MDTITGIVLHTIRHGHTMYGNPMLSVVLSTNGYIGSYRISDNAALVYQIENANFHDTPHTFELTRAGRIARVVR